MGKKLEKARLVLRSVSSQRHCHRQTGLEQTMKIHRSVAPATRRLFHPLRPLSVVLPPSVTFTAAPVRSIQVDCHCLSVSVLLEQFGEDVKVDCFDFNC